MNFKIAIAQYSPYHLDLEKSLDKLEGIVRRASLKGADMVVFGETWLSGYPAWLDYSSDIGLWDHAPMKKVYQTFHENAVDVNGKERQLLENICKQNGIALCVGINEKGKKGKGQGTVYNSILTINNTL